MRPARQLVLWAAFAGGAVTLAGCGGASRDATIERYECSQVAGAVALANAAADVTGRRNATTPNDDVARLHVPALRPVAIAAADGGLLPWGAMTDPQRDTWSAWQALDGGRLIEDARIANFSEPDTVSRCDRAAIEPVPDGGLSDSAVAEQTSRGYPVTIERAADRIIRGSRNGKLVDALATALAYVPSSAADATYLGDVESSALTGPPSLVYDGDGDGYLGATADYRNGGLRWSPVQLVLMLDAVGTRSDDWRRFLTALARVQARQILASTESAPGATTDSAWAAQLGAMDALLGEVLVLPGNGSLKDSVASFPNAVIRAVNGGDDAAIGRALDSSHPDHVTGGLLRDGYKFAIAAGFVQNRVLTVPAGFGTNGRIPSLTALPSNPQAQLYYWIGNGKAGQVMDPALQAADWAFTDRALGCCPG